MKDYYAILGVDRSAGQDEIKKAFRRLARESHPDANPGDPTAEARFREVAEAYEILSDPQRRARYDRGESIDMSDLFASFGGLNDILSSFFGGSAFGSGGISDLFTAPARGGNDLLVEVKVDLLDTAVGVEKELTFVAPTTCETCSGSGAAPGTTPVRCRQCGGSGTVQVTRRTLLGQMATLSTCDVCRGRGETADTPCPSCDGRQLVDAERKITVAVPPGVETGSRLRLRGKGGDGERGSRPGDLYVEVSVVSDDRFERDGEHLRYRLPVGYAELALGTELEVPLIDGSVAPLEIPAGTQPGTVFRIRNQGVGRLNGRGRGDLMVMVDVTVPTDLSAEEEDLLRAFAELRNERPGRPRRRRRAR